MDHLEHPATAESADDGLLDAYREVVKQPPLVERAIMSLSQFFAQFGGEQPQPQPQPKRSSRDARREKVETAVKRLDTAIARNHEIGTALKESYREAAESSKQVLECLGCPRTVEATRLHIDECEDLP